MLISSCRPTDIRADFIAAATATAADTTATATSTTAAATRQRFTIKLEEANKLMPKQRAQATATSMYVTPAYKNLKTPRQLQ